MAARQQVLDKTDLFGALPPELLEQLRGRTALAKYRRGDVDLREGRPGDAAVRRVLGPGRDHRQGERRPRVGDLGARPGRAVRRDVDVRRRRPLGERPGAHDGAPDLPSSSTTCARCSPTGPRCCGPSCAILARRLRATDEALADAMFLDVTGRTAKRLLELADGEDEFRMPLTQEELAGMVGASRERVNKAIATFVQARLARDLGPQPATASSTATSSIDRARIELDRRALRRQPRRSRRSLRCPAASAASSARCTGRSGSCTKPCSAPSIDDDLAVVAALPRGRAARRCRRPACTGRPCRRSRASGTSSAATSSGSIVVPGPSPVLGRAQHAVERDRGVEAIGRRGLERVVAAHAEAEHRHAVDVVFDDEQVAARVEDRRAAASSSSVVHRGRCGLRCVAERVRVDARRTARPRTRRSRASRAAGPCPRTAAASPPMSGCSTTPATRHAVGPGVARSARRSRRRRASAARP